MSMYAFILFIYLNCVYFVIYDSTYMSLCLLRLKAVMEANKIVKYTTVFLHLTICSCIS